MNYQIPYIPDLQVLGYLILPDAYFFMQLFLDLLFIFFVLFVLSSMRNEFFTILKNKIFGGRIAQVHSKAGGSYLENQENIAGFYTGKHGSWQACVNGIVHGEDYPYVIENEKLGVCLTIPAAAGIKALMDMGYNDLAEVVAEWDQDVLNWNKKDISQRLQAKIKSIEESKDIEAIEKAQKIEDLKKEYELNDVQIQQIIMRGRNQLLELKLDFYTPYVIPLQQVYTWAIQEIDAINTKKLIEIVRIQTREKMAKEQTALLTPNNVLLFMMILIGGAVAAYIIMNGGSNVPSVPTIIPTTTLP